MPIPRHISHLSGLHCGERAAPARPREDPVRGGLAAAYYQEGAAEVFGIYK